MLLAELRPPERNVRIHTEQQIKELARAVTMFGQTRPVVVDENNTVLAGNGLVAALNYLKRSKVAVHRVSGLSEIDKQKLMLSDNRIFELGHDDHDAIVELIRAVGDVDIPGFDADSLATALTAVTVPEMTTVPTPRPTRAAVPKPGTGAPVTPDLTCPHCGHEFSR